MFLFAVLVAPVILVAAAFKYVHKKEFDVFLSFSSEGAPKDFADRLHRSLVDAGICVFRGGNGLRRGEKIGRDRVQAIKKSKILIPILFSGYGSNGRCLNELVHIMDSKNDSSGQVVLPIFYGMERGEIAGSDQKEEWKRALEEVSSLRGWESRKVANGDEGQLVELVVRKVLIELKKVLEPVITENSVGIKGPKEKIMDFVDSRGSTVYVGIHGEVGVGKTALAKVIYNKLSKRFDYCSFIPNVAESCKCNGIEYVQNQLILDLGNTKGSKGQLLYQKKGSKGQLTATISSKFKDKKVLILLDDVNANDQLKALAGERNWFAPGSRIIITTREESILDHAHVDHKHEHKAMEEAEAMILFARHAFGKDSPPEKFCILSDTVISTVPRIPLILEVMGSYLCGKNQTSWENTKRPLQLLQQLQNSQEWLEKILTIVYYALKVEQRKIFLDIACFLVGSDARIASYMWDTSDFNPMPGIEELISMSLIKIGRNHELMMHDKVIDFGRRIVREGRCNEPDNGNRLWDYEEAFGMLGRDEGAANTRGLSLDKGSGEITQYTNKQFENLVNLRFLRVSDADFVGDFKEIFSKLRWLQWERRPNKPLEKKKSAEAELPKVEEFAEGELAVLDLSRSKISDNWSGWTPILSSAKKLKVLNLTGCDSLESTFFLSTLKHLEILILRNCHNVNQFLFIGGLETLVSLDLRGCSGLTKLPEGVGNLGGLKELFLDQTLIDEIGDIMSLVNLQRLSLQSCPIVTLCPDSFLKLESLVELVLTDTKITELPESVGYLQNLEILKISGTGIAKLGDCIGRLRKLRELDASGCEKLEEVTPRICDLYSLQSLDLRNCLKLPRLPKLPPSLTVVTVTCKSVDLPSFSDLILLKQLRLRNCERLKYIPVLPSTTLDLEISRCGSLESLTPPEAVKDFEVSLKRLDIMHCDKLERLDLSQLSRLRVLRALDCTKIREIGGLGGLESLESLTIQKDTSIELDRPYSSPRERAYD